MLLPGQNRFTALRQFQLHDLQRASTSNPNCDGADPRLDDAV